MAQEIKEFDSLVDVMNDLDALGIQGAQRYKTVNGFVALKARYRNIPVSGTFELTPLCNLDCKMCYVHLTSNQLKKDERLLTVDEWKTIIRQAVDAGMISASITGGECLTYYGFKDIYLYFRSLGIQADILTNGLLLSEEMVNFFAENPPGIMQVTLYGSSEDAYERVTGRRAFRKVMDGIERAVNAGLNITLAITPNRFIKDDVSPLLDLVHSLNIPYTIGGVTLQARSETQRELLDYVVDLDTYFKLQSSEKAFLATLPKDENASIIPKYVPKTKSELSGLPCGGGHSAFHVNWKGELCPCIAFSGSVHHSILDRDFKSAWELVKDTMSAYSLPKECESCENKNVCSSCPGERSMSELSGSLNRIVCQRLQRTIEWNK